jgi:hypothetical protein
MENNNRDIRINMRSSYDLPHLVFCNCARCSQLYSRMDSMRVYNTIMANIMLENLFNNFSSEYDLMQDEYINRLFNQSNSELERNEKIKIDVNSKPFSDTEKVFTSCTICSDEYKDDDSVCVLDCSHVFHKNCIEEWGHYNPICPICKSSIKQKKEADK